MNFDISGIIKLDGNIYYENNQILFNELIDLICKNRNTYSNILIHSRIKLLNWINDQLPLLSSDFYKLSTKCYWILTGLIDFPICQTCQKNDGFKDKNVKLSIGYKRFCCVRCAQLDQTVNKHKKQGCLKSLGVEHPLQAKTCMDKFHSTCLNNFGVDHNFKAESCIKKRKETWMKNYGYDHPMKSQKAKNYILNSIENKYNVKNISQLQDIKSKKEKTCLKNYCVKYPLQSKEIQDDIKQTCLAKYGVKHYVQSDDFKEKSKKKYLYLGIYFHSKPELALYIWLKDHKITFEYQPRIKFKYEFNGLIHFYNPDFKINNKYFEIKGDHFFKDGKMICPFRNKEWDDEQYMLECAKYEAKHQCMIQNDVKILKSEQYKTYIRYVASKYGSDFISLFKVK